MTLALVDCLSARCTDAFKTFAEMAAHQLAAHGVPIAETYDSVGEPMPAAAPTATPIRKEQPAPKPENRMPPMARGICRMCQVSHGRAVCPKKKAGAEPPKRTPKAGACTYCRRADGTHTGKCPRGKATSRKPAAAPMTHIGTLPKAGTEVLVIEVGPGGGITTERLDRALWKKALTVLAALGGTA